MNSTGLQVSLGRQAPASPSLAHRCPKASTASASRRNSVTRTSERRFGMFIRFFPEERADRFLPALRFLHEWIPYLTLKRVSFIAL